MNQRLYRTGPRFLGAVLLLGSLGAVVTSCTTSATEIVAGTTTQIQVSKELGSIGVVIRFGGELISCQGYDVTNGDVTIPHTLGLVPQEGREGVLQPVTITVIGFRDERADHFTETCLLDIPSADAPEVLVVRSRRMPYTVERILYLPIPLRESCTGKVCPDDQTCFGGACEDNLVPEDSAVDYSDALVFGNTNTCFSPSRCLPAGVTQPAILTDEATCTFRYSAPPGAPAPDTVPGGLNVEIMYQSFGTEVLDLDDKEGFVFPDEKDPLTFRLAKNMCEENFQKGKIVGVFAAPLCPAKRALQPICSGELAGILTGERSPPPPTSEVLCSVGDTLTASESALYVLLDRSASMSELFVPEGLEFVVGVPLRNPVAARTLLALSFLPAAASDCADSSYDSPDFGFADVEDVRLPIAEALGDPGTLLADDPQLFLDGAMSGAYEALGNLMPVATEGFNRKALIIVGNRDLQSHCPGAPDNPAELAAAAKAMGIFTYVAVLDAPAGAEQFGDNPQASAAAIASAGGTEVFDAIADEAAGGLAVQKVLNDLGSCVYDPPETALVADFATHLAYVDPTTLVRTDIARNESCDGELASQSVNGWGIEPDGRVRICGQPCEDLRTTLSDVATYFLLLGEPAPQVAVVALRPCAERFSPP